MVCGLIESHPSLQSLHGCTLSTVAWVVELMYLQVVVVGESLLGGHGKAHCTVIQLRECTQTLTKLF